MRQSRVRKARLSPDPTSGDDHQVFSAYPQTTESDAIDPQVLPQPRSPARYSISITTHLEEGHTATGTPDSTSMTEGHLGAAAFGASTDSLPPTISGTLLMVMENSNSQKHEPVEPRGDKGEPKDDTEPGPVQSALTVNRESISEEEMNREQLLAALRSAREQNQSLSGMLERRWSLGTGVTAPPQYEESEGL